MGDTEKHRRRQHRTESELDDDPTAGVSYEVEAGDLSTDDPGLWPPSQAGHSDPVKADGGIEHLDTRHEHVPDQDDSIHVAAGHLLGGLGSFSEALEHIFNAIGKFLENLPEHPD